MTRNLWRRVALFCGMSCLSLSIGCSKPTAEIAETKLPSDEELRDRIDRAIDFTGSGRHLDTKNQAAWQIVHGALVYGRDFQIYHDGQLVGALDYLLDGGQLRGWTLRKGDHGLEAVLDAGSKTGQGHEDQWLGYLSQCGLKMDQPVTVDGQQYRVNDLITQAQWDIYDGMEATWTLMAFATYLPLDAEWQAKDGTTWSIPRIVEMEAAQNLDESACGGTHRMYGLAVALKRYLRDGGKIDPDGDGPWDKAQRKVDEAVAAARQNQQPDGSFSTNYFARPATSPEIATRIGASGHSLEFLTVALSDEQLEQPWVTRAASNLVENLERTQKFDLECGALYHAAHGLELYRERRFGPRSGDSQVEPAKAAAATTAAGG
jgi:ribosomal protein S18